MDPVRVHIGPMPPMLRTIMTDLLSTHDDIQIAGSSHESLDSLPAARAEGANAIIAVRGSEDACLEAVVHGPPLTIILVSPGGGTCTAVTLSRRQLPLGDKSMSVLAHVLREAARD